MRMDSVPSNEQRFARKDAIDNLRAGLIRAGNPDSMKVLALVAQLQNQRDSSFEGDLFPLVAAMRNAVSDLVDPHWLYTDGMRKALKIRVPKALIISDSLKIHLGVQLEGCIYVVGNRALFFFPDSTFLCDVSSCEPEQLMKLYNPTTVQRLADHFQHKGYTKDPQEILVSLLDQARGLNSDYEDSGSREFDRDEEPGAFKLRLSDFQTALVDTLAWQEWLETASEEDIKREMRMGNPHLLKLLDDESDKASIDRAQRAPHLFLVKNDNTLPI